MGLLNHTAETVLLKCRPALYISTCNMFTHFKFAPSVAAKRLLVPCKPGSQTWVLTVVSSLSCSHCTDVNIDLLSSVQVWRIGWTCACFVCPSSTACSSSSSLCSVLTAWSASSGRTWRRGGSGQCIATPWVWSGDFCSVQGVWPWSSPWKGACAFFCPSERHRWSEPARWLSSSSPP